MKVRVILHDEKEDIRPDALRELVENGSFPAISIYTPTVVAGRDRKENAVRIEYALRQAEERLHAQHLFTREMEETFSQARVQLDRFLEQSNLGAAVFVSTYFVEAFWLPFTPHEVVIVNGMFHTKPLLPMLTGGGRFHLLALSQKRCAFFEGDERELRELDVPGMPRRFSEVYPGAQIDEENQAAVVVSSGGVGKCFSPRECRGKCEAGRVALCKLDLQAVVVRGVAKKVLVCSCGTPRGATRKCGGVFRQ